MLEGQACSEYFRVKDESMNERRVYDFDSCNDQVMNS